MSKRGKRGAQKEMRLKGDVRLKKGGRMTDYENTDATYHCRKRRRSRGGKQW